MVKIATNFIRYSSIDLLLYNNLHAILFKDNEKISSAENLMPEIESSGPSSLELLLSREEIVVLKQQLALSEVNLANLQSYYLNIQNILYRLFGNV